MAPSELIRHVTEVLNDLEIPYFITGSVASIVYGEPRETADVDIVAEVQQRHVSLLFAAFQAEPFYVSKEAILEAIRTSGQFNIIDSSSGYKAGIIVPTKTTLNRSRFERAIRIQPANADRRYWFSSPEDVIIKKLEAHREGGSDKHLRDVTGILKTIGPNLDRQYIDQWSNTLGLTDLWQQVCERTGAPR